MYIHVCTVHAHVCVYLMYTFRATHTVLGESPWLNRILIKCGICTCMHIITSTLERRLGCVQEPLSLLMALICRSGKMAISSLNNLW